jgi:hypothetical protein
VANKTEPKTVKRGHATVRSARRIVGVWEQETNPFHTTTVVYTIAFESGRLLVGGVDEEDGTVFKVSNVRWDGKKLCFYSLFPPTGHKAGHVLHLLGTKRAKHQVTYSDEEGNYVGEEIWRKRRSNLKLHGKPVSSPTSKRRLT